MNPTLTHIALHVRDLDACLAFYLNFCGMTVVHERLQENGQRVVWIAEPGKAHAFIFVLMPGGLGRDQDMRDYSHLGFACISREAVDAIADKARKAGCLVWEPREEPYPVGYYCGVRDPDGNFVEFSYGQPLGPGAEEAKRKGAWERARSEKKLRLQWDVDLPSELSLSDLMSTLYAEARSRRPEPGVSQDERFRFHSATAIPGGWRIEVEYEFDHDFHSMYDKSETAHLTVDCAVGGPVHVLRWELIQ